MSSSECGYTSAAPSLPPSIILSPTNTPSLSPIPANSPTSNCFQSISEVRLKSGTGEPLQIYEVQVFSSGSNVALQGSATQSSTLKDSPTFAAANAIDGSNTTFSHTAADDEAAYWKVSLQDAHDVDSVVIINRWCQDPSDMPGCLCRLSYSTLSLIDRDGLLAGTRTLGDTCKSAIVSETFTSGSSCPTRSPTSSPTSSATEIPTHSSTVPCHPSARKIRLESTTGQQLQMFELRAISSAINVAMNKSATQSSDLRDQFGASNAVDGNNLTFSHTNDANAYFEVDLGSTFEIESVEIVNRWCKNEADQNGCLCRLSYANLTLLDEDNSLLASTMFGNTCNETIVSESFTTCSAPPSVSPTPSCNKSTKQVKIESTTGEPIQIYEVEAYTSSGTNVAINGSAIQSSTLKNSPTFVAANAIDGNEATFSHTSSGDVNPYLQIVLATMTEIDNVRIINRWCGNPSDEYGCLCRLSNAELTVYDENDSIVATKTFGDTCGLLELSLELCQ